MRLFEISPFVRQAVVTHMSQGKTLFHRLKTRDHRLFYILGGKGSIVISGISYPIMPGMLILFPSGTEYSWQVEDMPYVAVNFDLTRANTDKTASFHVEYSENVTWVLEPDISLEDSDLFAEPLVLYHMAHLERTMTNLAAEFSVKGPYCEELVSSMLRLVIITALRERSTADDVSRSHCVRDVIAYVHENYSRPIRNTDIADALHYNPSYMNRLFKSYTGMTVRAFLIDYRINAATDLLISTDLPIAEVASLVGFTDLPHFTKTFKAHTGASPTDYRTAR